MRKTLLSLIILTQFNFAATSEQVEQYLMVSKADTDLVAMEQMLDELMPVDSSKNTEVIESRFHEYLEKNFSEQEIIELIKLYKNPLLQTLREVDSDLPEEELKEFNLSIQENPISSERLDLNKEIIKNMLDDEDLKNMLHGFEEKIQQITGTEDTAEAFTEEDEKEFLKTTREEFMLPMLYTTQTLGMEELHELKDLTNTSLIKKANKVEFNGTMYAIKELLGDMIQGMMNQLNSSLSSSLGTNEE